MAKYQTILFDADNTLLDFYKSEHDALIAALKLQNIFADEKTVKVYSQINDGMWKKLERCEIKKSELRTARFAELVKYYDWTIDVQKLSNDYIECLSEQSYLMSSALEVCKKLAETCDLYIITNGIYSVQKRRFAKTPLMPYIKKSFISELIGFEKPDVAYFKAVEKEIPHFNASKTLVVGDSLTSDIAGGIRAGLDTCWFNTFKKPIPKDMDITYVIENLEELLPLILG